MTDMHTTRIATYELELASCVVPVLMRAISSELKRHAVVLRCYHDKTKHEVEEGREGKERHGEEELESSTTHASTYGMQGART